MSFYRSQTIERFKIYLPRQSAWNIMNQLGKQELMHVIPNKNVQILRHFTLQIKRVEESLQKIESLEEVLMQKKMIEKRNVIEKENYKEIFSIFDSSQVQQDVRNQANKVNKVIERVDELWSYFNQINKRIEMLEKQINLCRQNIAVLLAGEKEYGRAFFHNQKQRSKSYDNISLSPLNKINYKAGVIYLSEQIRFKRTVFRISKGNCFVFTKKFSEIFNQLSITQSQKVVFFVIYPANNQSYFDRKLSKLILSFCSKSFQYPTEFKYSYQQNLDQFTKTYQQAINIKKMCENQLQIFLYQKLLQKFKKNSNLHFGLKKYEYLQLYLIKEKYIYHNLNQMNVFNHFFQGQIFIKKQSISKMQDILNKVGNTGQLPPGNIIPISSKQHFPSSFVLNDYTTPSQQIVETYGVPRYKQINPSYFTVITFPFLFGVMFGDIAHGSIILLFGSFLVLQRQKIKHFNNEILNLFIPYRYLITLMGIFSIYCGFIYNEFLSLSLNIFGTCYQLQNVNQGQQIGRFSSECVYSIGIDPVWSVAQNSLNFTNSLKMKISVIIGVIHMTLGVILRSLNDIHFKHYKQLIFVFIPQLLFLLVTFGYMDFLIIFKWCMPWLTEKDTSLAPSIITQMIDLPLALGSTQGKPLWTKNFQQNLQYCFLIIAGISIPTMLLPVPLMKIFKIQRKIKPKKKQMINQKNHQYSDIQNELNQMLIQRQKEGLFQQQQPQLDSFEQLQSESSSEIFVHQIIQTIQYVLGSVSNTASYLRLWALSLAHSQLSQVFFQKTVQGSLQVGWSGIIMNLIGFFFLACITIGIMLLMDSMQCFLHTLRLHWVQFQGKFYKGDGFAFKSYSFYEKTNQQLRMKAK